MSFDMEGDPSLAKRDSIAVLVMFFNRTECLQSVLARVREIRPQRLYLAADGPRKKRPGEQETCESVRQMALQMIDWPCEVKTLFRKENLGCGLAVSGAISWFFDQENEGIILEDDCLVDESFFDFAAELLERYRNDERIGIISALNVAGASVPFRYSYDFSRLLFGCWGWASWRRVWKQFDIDCALLPDLEQNNELFFARDYHERWFMTTSIHGIHELGNYNTWDYQLTFANLIQSRLSIVPSVNLVQNLGDTFDGTHTPSQILHQATRSAGKIAFPLQHPPYVMPHSGYDEFYKRNIMPPPPSRAYRCLKSCAKALKLDEFIKSLKRQNRGNGHE